MSNTWPDGTARSSANAFNWKTDQPSIAREIDRSRRIGEATSKAVSQQKIRTIKLRKELKK